MELAALVVKHLFRRGFQLLGMAQAVFHHRKQLGVYRAAAHALIHGNADRQRALAHHIAARIHGIAALGRAHGDEHAGVAEIVDMVVHAHQADGGVVGDEHAGVEGQAVQQCLGQQAVAVQQLHQPRRQTGEQRNLQHGGGQLYRKAGGFRPAVLRNQLLDARADVVDGVGGIEKDLDGVFLNAAGTGYGYEYCSYSSRSPPWIIRKLTLY